jgi:hypothetical protein
MSEALSKPFELENDDCVVANEYQETMKTHWLIRANPGARRQAGSRLRAAAKHVSREVSDELLAQSEPASVPT